MDRASLRAKSPSLIGTALYGAVRRVVWDPWLALVSHGDPIRLIVFFLKVVTVNIAVAKPLVVAVGIGLISLHKFSNEILGIL